VAEVQNAIPPQTALVEFIRYHHYLGRQQWEDRYGAVTLASNAEPKWVCLGAAAAIDKDVRICQQSVRDKESKDEALLSSALHNMYRRVWAPLATVLPADGKTIVISPDASLNFVSFATLLTPDNKFLAEKYSIRYVASGRDLLLEPVKSTNQNMVVFAAPDYFAGGEVNQPQTGVQLLPQKWTPSFGQENAEIKLGSQALRD
jgi:CHAT domain-containing protein